MNLSLQTQLFPSHHRSLNRQKQMASVHWAPTVHLFQQCLKQALNSLRKIPEDFLIQMGSLLTFWSPTQTLLIAIGVWSYPIKSTLV